MLTHLPDLIPVRRRVQPRHVRLHGRAPVPDGRIHAPCAGKGPLIRVQRQGEGPIREEHRDEVGQNIPGLCYGHEVGPCGPAEGGRMSQSNFCR